MSTQDYYIVYGPIRGSKKILPLFLYFDLELAMTKRGELQEESAEPLLFYIERRTAKNGRIELSWKKRIL